MADSLSTKYHRRAVWGAEVASALFAAISMNRFGGAYFTYAMAVFLLSCVGIGLSISAVAKNMQQVIVYNFVVLLPIMLLSGMATPVRNMPTVLQYFTYINPMRFAIDGVRRVYIEGASLSMIASDFIPMLIVAAVTMPLAAWMFRHKLG